jgi:hypothetical protein
LKRNPKERAKIKDLIEFISKGKGAYDDLNVSKNTFENLKDILV